MRTLVAAVVCGLIVFVGLIAQDGPETVVRGTKQFRQSEVVTGLAGPFEVTWGPDNMLWVTERTGKRITRVNPATGERKVAVTIDEVLAPGGQDGLMGLALDLGNNFVYTAYTYTDKSLPPHETRARDEPVSFSLHEDRPLDLRSGEGDAGQPRHARRGHARGQRPSGRADEDRAGSQALLHDRRPGKRSARQLLRAHRSAAAADAGGDPGEELRRVRGEVAAAESRRLDSQRQSGDRRRAEPRLHLRPSQSAGNRFRSGWHVVRIGARSEDRRRDQHSEGGRELRVAACGGNEGRQGVRVRPVGGVDDAVRADQVQRPGDCPRRCRASRSPRSPGHSTEPIATMFTVPTGYNFSDPVCSGIDYICWPTVGASSIEYYGSPRNSGIPGWEKALLVTTLKRGSLYVVALSADGQSVRGPFSRYFQSDNRYRDTAVSPDGKTIYIATDPAGLAEATAGGTTRTMTNKGSILAFTYVGEGTGAAVEPQRTTTVAPARPQRRLWRAPLRNTRPCRPPRARRHSMPIARCATGIR